MQERHASLPQMTTQNLRCGSGQATSTERPEERQGGRQERKEINDSLAQAEKILPNSNL